MLSLMKVSGASMEPALHSGDYILMTKPRRLTAGLIYVVDHIDLGRIVKRLDYVEDGHAYFIGDNKASTPQTIMGKVELSRMKGRVIFIIGKTGLRRPAPAAKPR